MMVNSCWCVANSSFTFWNFLEFEGDIFHPLLVEFMNVEPVDMKDVLYMLRIIFCNYICDHGKV